MTTERSGRHPPDINPASVPAIPRRDRLTSNVLPRQNAVETAKERSYRRESVEMMRK
jgi:hypothetical protein